MDKLSNEQKERELTEFQIKQDKRIFAGKIITISIASINIVISVVSFFGTLNIFSLIIQIILSVAFISGVTWVRYFFAVGLAINVFVILYVLLASADQVSLPMWITVVLCIQLVYSIISCIILFTNKCVGEYMYAKKNG